MKTGHFAALTTPQCVPFALSAAGCCGSDGGKASKGDVALGGHWRWGGEGSPRMPHSGGPWLVEQSHDCILAAREAVSRCSLLP